MPRFSSLASAIALVFIASGSYAQTPPAPDGSTTLNTVTGSTSNAAIVLVSGYRAASFAFALTTQDTFVDLSALPIRAVDRVELLKDGASAVYGTDATAGVINTILRHNAQGVEVHSW